MMKLIIVLFFLFVGANFQIAIDEDDELKVDRYNDDETEIGLLRYRINEIYANIRLKNIQLEKKLNEVEDKCSKIERQCVKLDVYNKHKCESDLIHSQIINKTASIDASICNSKEIQKCNNSATRKYGITLTPFNVNVKDLLKIEVHHTNFVAAIRFIFLNGSDIQLGVAPLNSTISSTPTLVNKKITGITLRLGSYVDSIQFELFDTQTNSYELTDQMGGNGGQEMVINSSHISPTTKFFEIIQLGVMYSGRIRDITLVYSYDTPKTIGKFERESFDVKFKDLAGIYVNHGDYVHATNFTFKNGTYKFNGHIRDSYNLTIIPSLVNKRVVAIILRIGIYIDSMQFQLFDTNNETYEWVGQMGGNGGEKTILNARTLAPRAKYFEITGLKGVYSHSSRGLLKELTVTYCFDNEMELI